MLRTGCLAGVVVLTLGVARADAQTQWDVAGTAGLFSARTDAVRGLSSASIPQWERKPRAVFPERNPLRVDTVAVPGSLVGCGKAYPRPVRA